MGTAVGTCEGAEVSVVVAPGVDDGDRDGEADVDGAAEAVAAGDGLSDCAAMGTVAVGPEHATASASVAASARQRGLIRSS